MSRLFPSISLALTSLYRLCFSVVPDIAVYRNGEQFSAESLETHLIHFDFIPGGLYMSVCLNGSWEYVTDTGERGTCAVPGLVTAPDVMCGVTLFRNITLPPKPFTRLMLELKGARFRPEITVNGETVAFSEGGMCAIRAVFSHRDCVPGANVRIGIRLCGLHEVPR